jgi:hypothetical protein
MYATGPTAVPGLVSTASVLPFVGVSAARADDVAATGDDFREYLHWTSDGGAELRLRGWLLTDFVTFPRTETGYGTSQHSDFVLRSARVSARFGLADMWAGRLDADLTSDQLDAEEAWFEYRQFEFFDGRVVHAARNLGLGHGFRFGFARKTGDETEMAYQNLSGFGQCFALGDRTIAPDFHHKIVEICHLSDARGFNAKIRFLDRAKDRVNWNFVNRQFAAFFGRLSN